MRTEQMHIRINERFKQQLDALRRAEEDLPSRTEMLHRLVERAAALAVDRDAT